MRVFSACLLIGLAIAAQCTAGTAGATLVPLEPVMEGGKPQSRTTPDGARQAPVLQHLAAGPMATSLASEARTGATAFILELDALAQRIAGNTQPTPTYLFLSQEEGGFPRQGFWLQLREGKPQWHADPYVDLIVDAGSIKDGSFEEIFAHESGHVLLRRLLPNLPAGYSRNRHASQAVTDYPTAFDEGFATHFQAVARLLTRNPQLRSQDAGTSFKPFLPYWRDHIDRNLRTRGVRDNLFVQRQLPWPANPASDNPDATTLFDPTQLKNGQQMMASEGVIATLFYHLMAEPAGNPAQLHARYEELFLALKALSGTTLKPDSPVFLRVARQVIEQTPSLRSRWLQTIVGITYGATVERNLPRQTEALALSGREGAEQFIEQLAAIRKSLAALTREVERNPERLTAALGPEIWVAADPSGPPVNLNTAERDTLVLLLKLDPTTAERALQSRRSQSPFASIEDFAARAGLSGARVMQFTAAARAISEAGPVSRQ